MSVTHENVEMNIVTIRTPLFVRRILIWDMDAQSPLNEELDMQMAARTGVVRRGEAHAKDQRNEGTGRSEDGWRRTQAGNAADDDGR